MTPDSLQLLFFDLQFLEPNIAMNLTCKNSKHRNSIARISYDKHYKIAVCIAILLSCFLVNAQPAGVRKFSLQDGNIAPKINSMVQNANGYLLLGTTNGLFRFNGLHFDKIPVDTFIGSHNVTAV